MYYGKAGFKRAQGRAEQEIPKLRFEPLSDWSQ
jgi:hypothetical protein